MQTARLAEAQAGIKISRRNISTNTILMAKNERGSKEPLDEGERGE